MSKKNDFTELEDGEIDSDGGFDDIYTPLERPVRNDTNPPRFIESDVDDNDNDNSSSTDSDSSGEGCPGPKLKKKNKPIKQLNSQKPKQNKLKIWCHVLEDESVSNNLTDCNLDETQMRIRGLLPYTKNLNHNSHKGNYNSNAGKRNHSGQFVNEKKHFKDNKSKNKKGASKCIPSLSANAEKSDELLAKEIANKLNEVKSDLILRAVQIAGKQKIIPIFEETRKTEKSGGMLVMNGSRRRTPGGVFFYLLKTSTEIPQQQLKNIFFIDKQDSSAQNRKQRQNKPVKNLAGANKASADGKIA